MLVHYLKTGIRGLLKNKLYSAINIFGLAIGLTVVMLILMYLRQELRFDDFHIAGDRTYRISVISHRGGAAEGDSPEFTPPLGPAMAVEFPEVEAYTRLSTLRPAYLGAGDRTLRLDNIRYADSTFFNLFSFEVSDGDPHRMLTAPNSVVLTKDVAGRMFGSSNALGQTVALDGARRYTVTGVVEAPPANSHLRFDLLVSFSTLFEDPSLYLDWDGGQQYITYVRLREGTLPESLERKFPGFMWRHINEKYAAFGIRLEPYLQPLRDIHLYHEPYSRVLRTNLYVFAAVALLLLFIACVNFVNLTTARAGWRAREVGVRKAVGASRRDLARQFLGESLLLSGTGFAGAMLLTEILAPAFQRMLDYPFSLSVFLDYKLLVLLFGLFLLVGIAAGSYPAFYLASLDATDTLKGKAFQGNPRQGMAGGLIVLQFAISTALIICTMAVHRQLQYTRGKDLGFRKEEMLVLPLVGDEVQSKYKILRQELSQLSQVRMVCASSEVPGNGFTSNGYVPQGQEKPMMIHVVDIDPDFLETYGIELKEGRAFDGNRQADRSAYLINEALVRNLNWDQPLDKTIGRGGDHRVIGVVKDFHFATLHDRIEPLLITNEPWQGKFDYLTLRLAPGPPMDAVAAIRGIWQRVLPNAPLDLQFLDEQIDQLYRVEERFRSAFFYTSALSITIALLGVFGLATISIEKRTREIGIRKVMGASMGNIVGLLSRDFLRLTLVALILAFPIAYWATQRWLSGFAYHIPIPWWAFPLAGALTVSFALMTVGLRTLKAATANPVKALKHE